MTTEDWTEQRPWGRFKNLLERPFTKVKLIEVDPGKRLSYQSHDKRQEAWVVVTGKARVTLNGEAKDYAVGEQIQIDLGVKHRLENPGAEVLSVIEVQTGSYFGEDDIHRFEDDFGRLT